jgi:hypothetical protein
MNSMSYPFEQERSNRRQNIYHDRLAEILPPVSVILNMPSSK